MGQRLGLATALLGDPAVLVLDEPVNGLDPEGIRWLREFLRGLAAQGRTVFVSSHLMAEMAQTADQLVVIHRGRLLADMATEDFIARNARTFVRVRTGQPEQLHRELVTAGLTVVPTPDGSLEVSGATAAQISRLALARNLTLDELSTQDASLEEAFLKLTGTDIGVAR
jgi:ABC-2 type transport system ATP-binding protein